jgi:hypothetical protein
VGVRIGEPPPARFSIVFQLISKGYERQEGASGSYVGPNHYYKGLLPFADPL